MRRIVAASLLLPSLLLPAVVKASTPLDDASAPTPKVRVSTGVVAPELLDADHFTVPMDIADGPIPSGAEVGLTLTVDANGHAKDVKVVKSLSPVWDARVLDAVSRAHFKPGSIDTQPIPVDMNLTVEIAH